MAWGSLWLKALVVAATAVGTLFSVWRSSSPGRALSTEACHSLVGGAFCQLLFGSRSHSSVTVLGRETLVYLPRDAGKGAAEGRPAILVLHGSGDVARDLYSLGLEPLADELGFLVTYPEMEVPRSDVWGYDQDLPYFQALVQRLCAADFGADPQKIFIAGHSAGGTMALYLQNEVDLFAAAGAVAAGVGHLELWHLARRGRRTFLFWNHLDPVLAKFGGEDLYRQTIDTLRRHPGAVPDSAERLPVTRKVPWAELRRYLPDDRAPELRELSWNSTGRGHAWPQSPALPFDASRLLVEFFLEVPAAL